MVNHTRLDCLIGSAASMRTGTVHALHHARHRSAFGKLLADQPLMQNVLADLALDSEAATATAMRVARSYDEGKSASAFRRFATAVEKYWVCKRAPQHAIEALECLGGNGYVEESRMPRLYRDSPLNSIWEGSGNVAALDVLRAMVKEPDGLPAFLEECELARGSNKHLDAHLDSVKAEIAGLVDAGDTQTQARRVVERLALTLQGSLLVRNAPAAVSDAFCAARLGGEGGRAYGTLPAGRRHAGDPGPRAPRVNLNQPDFDEPREAEGFRARRAGVGRRARQREARCVALGARRPGEAAYPYHWHLAEEELLVVIAGRPSLRTPGRLARARGGRGRRVPARRGGRAPARQPHRGHRPLPRVLDPHRAGDRDVPGLGEGRRGRSPASA